MGTPLAPVPHSAPTNADTGTAWSPLDWLIAPASADTLPPSLPTTDTTPFVLPGSYGYLSVGGGDSGVGPVDQIQPLPEPADTTTTLTQTDVQKLADVYHKARSGQGNAVSDTDATEAQRILVKAGETIAVDGQFGRKSIDAAHQFFSDYYTSTIQTAAEWNGVPTEMLKAQIDQESGFDYMAASKEHGNIIAVGIAQFTKGTGGDYGLVGTGFDNRTDPQASIFAQARYMAKLYSDFPQAKTEDDRWRLALAAYNAGPANIRAAMADYAINKGLATGLYNQYNQVNVSKLNALSDISASDVLNELPAGTQIWSRSAFDGVQADPFEFSKQTQDYVQRIMGLGPNRTGLILIYSGTR